MCAQAVSVEFSYPQGTSELNTEQKSWYTTTSKLFIWTNQTVAHTQLKQMMIIWIDRCGIIYSIHTLCQNITPNLNIIALYNYYESFKNDLNV